MPEIEIDIPVSVTYLTEDGPQLLIGFDSVDYIIKGRKFTVRAGGFFQVNLRQAERLVDLVMDQLALNGGERILDLYSGVGLFTAFIADQASSVIAVEGYLPAVEDAERNLGNLNHVELYAGAVEDVLTTLEGQFDAVVLDPPRAGVAPEALDALVALAPTKIVYVSCDLATFARDAKRLASKGYTFTYLQPVDMFPQTASIELVAAFIRN
jgi:23S rRNA (uracil1939-C5)-methyltransferase